MMRLRNTNLHMHLVYYATTILVISTATEAEEINVLGQGFADIQENGCNGPAQRHVRESFHPYSALRDPVGQEVRVFLDAQAWLMGHWYQCIFTDGSKEWREEGHHVALPAEIKIHTWDKAVRQFEGYVMFCPDPGSNYTVLMLTEFSGVHDCALHSIPVETIPVAEQRSMGACVAPLFSMRSTFSEWLNYTMNLGFTHIHAYFTIPRDPLSTTQLMYVWHDDVYPLLPFQPIPHSNVTYTYYEAPINRYYFAQPSMYNECIFRYRRMHNFIIMLDVDEFLQDRHLKKPLAERLNDLLPQEAASIEVNQVIFPNDCHPNNGTENNLPGERFTHFHRQGVRHMRGKAIVRPENVRLFWVHHVIEPSEGIEATIHIQERDMYLKHIKLNWGCEDLVNASDNDAFEAAMG